MFERNNIVKFILRIINNQIKLFTKKHDVSNERNIQNAHAQSQPKCSPMVINYSNYFYFFTYYFTYYFYIQVIFNKN